MTSQRLGIVDVGSGRVRGAVVYLTPMPRFGLVSTAHDLNFTSEPPRQLDFLLTLTAKLRQIKNQLEKSAPVERWVVFLPSLLNTSQTKVIKWHRREMPRLDQNLINRIAEREITNFMAAAPDHDQFLESHILGLDERDDKWQLVQYLSSAPRSVVGRIALALDEGGPTPVEFCSAALASYYHLGSNHHLDRSSLILDPAGRLTDIDLIQDGQLLSHHSFPYGEQHILAGLKADDALNLYLANQMEGSSRQKLGQKLASRKETWLQSWREFIRNLVRPKWEPPTIFVFGSSPGAGLVAHWLKQEMMVSQRLGHPVAEIKLVENIPGYPDLALGAAADFYAKIMS